MSWNFKQNLSIRASTMLVLFKPIFIWAYVIPYWFGVEAEDGSVLSQLVMALTYTNFNIWIYSIAAFTAVGFFAYKENGNAYDCQF